MTFAQLWLAYRALAKIVVDEYPADYSLSEIANTWGDGVGVTDAEVEALRAIEAPPSVVRTGLFERNPMCSLAQVEALEMAHQERRQASTQ